MQYKLQEADAVFYLVFSAFLANSGGGWPKTITSLLLPRNIEAAKRIPPRTFAMPRNSERVGVAC